MTDQKKIEQVKKILSKIVDVKSYVYDTTNIEIYIGIKAQEIAALYESQKPQKVVCPIASECERKCSCKIPHNLINGWCKGRHDDCPECIPVPSTPAKPKIICLCGSTRFQNAFMTEYARLSEEGNIVLTVSKLIPQHEDIEPRLDKMRKWLHFRKIDLADEVLILNVGDYIGESTKGELEYAKQHGKTIRFLEPHSCQ